MRSLSRQCVDRVIAPEGGSIAASSCGASRGKRERDCESVMTLASPFEKGGSRGILLSHRLLIFNNNFFNRSNIP